MYAQHPNKPWVKYILLESYQVNLWDSNDPIQPKTYSRTAKGMPPMWTLYTLLGAKLDQ